MREQIQLESIQAWSATKKGTIILPTGTGKSYIGVQIVGRQIRSNKITSAMVVVPTTNLIKHWKDEFTKWGFPLDGIEFHCIKTAYKLDTSVDLLLIDEIHTSLSIEYRAVYDNVKHTQILGLTATVPHNEDYMELLNVVCPIVYEKKLEEVREILADFQIYNLPVPLSRREKAKYRIFDANFKLAQAAIGKLKKQIGKNSTDVFSIAQYYNELKDIESEVEALKQTQIFSGVDVEDVVVELVRQSKIFWSGMTMRKYVCYNSETKLLMAQKIIREFPGRRWILFNKTIKQAVLMAEILGDEAVVYHSKMSPSEKEAVLDRFSKDLTLRYLVAADALNAGLNVPDISAAISLSGTSVELESTQRMGRILRFEKNKQALFINLYADETIDKVWVESRNKNISSIWVDSLPQLIAHETRRSKGTTGLPR